MRGLFVSGTDTDIGKTVVSAIIAAYFLKRGETVSYYKPIQTGIERDCDATTVRSLVDGMGDLIASLGIGLKRPLSPHLSAIYQNSPIDFWQVVRDIKSLPTSSFQVIEGAGGLLVPIDSRHLIIDVIAMTSWPVVLVARSSLGTINHTLLSLEALRARKIPIAGVVMVGERNRDNEASIKFYGRMANILSIPLLHQVDQKAVLEVISGHKSEIDRFFSFY